MAKIFPTLKSLPRRNFLGAASALGASTLTGFHARAAESSSSPKIRLGIIGCGWYGMVDAKAALKTGGAEVAGICDVDSEHLTRSADELEKLQGTRPQVFKLYEDLLKMEALDAVVIATPPQWHALPFLAACDRGIDIYCEKPLAYDVREGRAMLDAARKSGRVIQIGFQRRQAAGFAEARRYLQDGQAGPIICADAQIHYTAGTSDPTPQPPPASLDWDLWCGPGPLIPYSPQVGHKSWRLEKTSGHGHLVDWGIHLIDTARWMLGAGAPKTVTATGGLYHLKGKITTPDVLTAHFEFETCPLTWKHRIWGAQEPDPETSNGIFFYGEKETVFCTDARWMVIPRGKGQERKIHEAKSDAGLLHMADFLDAVRSRRQPSCPIEEGHISTTAVKLAMISYDTGTKVVWDAQTEQIPGNPAAALLLKRDYRAPWQHPYRG